MNAGHRGRLLLAGAGAGLLHGVVFAAAFAPVGFWPACFLAMAPLLWAVDRLGRAREAGVPWRRRALLAVGVWLGVMPMWAYEVQWVIPITAMGYVPFVPALSAFAGVFVWLVERGRGRAPLWLLAPTLWTGMEVLRGEVIGYGFAWLFLGHPVIDAPLGPTLASCVGTYGASWVVLWVTCVGWMAAREWSRGRAIVAAACVMMVGVVLALVPGPTLAGGTVRVAAVQSNVPQDNKIDWTLDQREADLVRLIELTVQASRAQPRPDVIAWPETMFPGEFLEPLRLPDGTERYLLPEMVEAVLDLSRRIETPVLIGAIGADGLRVVVEGDRRRIDLDHRYNSVFVVHRGRVLGRYDKVELTPFGEVMPYAEHWPWLQRQILGFAAGGMAFDLTASRRVVGLEVPLDAGDGTRTLRLATPICFEITKTGLTRRLMAAARGDGPGTVILNVSNDGWFGTFDPAKEHHVQIARWRAAELGVPVVRSVNTGISCFIDARGRVKRDDPAAGPLANRTDGVAVAEVALGSGRTLYVRGGYVIGWVCVGAAAAMVVRGRRGLPGGGRMVDKEAAGA